jgi:hypothetical protein
MNRTAIELNNNAVKELQKGNTVKAFEMLTKASNITMDGVANHTHIDTGSSTYRFHWEDCRAAFAEKPSFPRDLSWEGCVPFLYMRGLRVTTACDEDIDSLCPCGYAWVVWYNLALCCNLLGTRLGERGQLLLKTAFDLYIMVQRRIDGEPSSRHWNVLQMAVTNNQACIFHDFSMREKANECLEKLATTLKSTPDVHEEDWEGFSLNLQILGNHNTVASAA